MSKAFWLIFSFLLFVDVVGTIFIDRWIWSNLLFAPQTIGGYIGFTILAILSIPFTIFTSVAALYLMAEMGNDLQ